MIEKGLLDYISEFWNVIDSLIVLFNLILLTSSIYCVETENYLIG